MSRPISPEATKQIENLVFAEQKIAAIRFYREHSGEGLKEAKDFVEAVEAELRAREPGKFAVRPAGTGCLGMLLLCGVGILSTLAVASLLLR